jgi:hypothetical protein
MNLDLSFMDHAIDVRRALGFAILLVLFATVTSERALAQPSLAEIARKEAERRKAQPSAGKVYTNKDLPASAQKPATPVTPVETAQPIDPVAAATAQQPPVEEPKPQEEPKGEAWWKGRMTQAREELRRNELFAEALESRINALTREYALPISGARRVAVGQQRGEAMDELSRVKQEIDRGKQLVADIEEEARKAGVPPGWLR